MRNETSGRNADLDLMFLPIVIKRKEIPFLGDSIESYAWRAKFLVVSCFRSSNRDVVVGFAIPVAQRELVPLLR